MINPTNLKECDETNCVDCDNLKYWSTPGCFGPKKIIALNKTRNINNHPLCNTRQEFEKELNKKKQRSKL